MSGPAALVHARDAHRRGVPQERQLGRAPLLRRDRVAGGAADVVVGVAGERAVGRPARRGAGVRREVDQRGRRERRVHVDPGQVDRRVARDRVQLGAGRRAVLRPAGLVPAVPQQQRVPVVPDAVADRVEHVGQRRGAGQVQPGAQQPGRRGVHVRVDERGRDERAVQVDRASWVPGHRGTRAPSQVIRPSSTAMAVAAPPWIRAFVNRVAHVGRSVPFAALEQLANPWRGAEQVERERRRGPARSRCR